MLGAAPVAAVGRLELLSREMDSVPGSVAVAHRRDGCCWSGWTRRCSEQRARRKVSEEHAHEHAEGTGWHSMV